MSFEKLQRRKINESDRTNIMIIRHCFMNIYLVGFSGFHVQKCKELCGR